MTGKDIPPRRMSTIALPEKKPERQIRSPLNICIVTRDLFGWSEPTDTAAAAAGLAQHIAAQGDAVTLIWVPPHDSPADEESIAKLTDYYLGNHLIALEVLNSSPQLLLPLWGCERAAAGLYFHLKERKFDAVYISLEGGLAYYALLAKELGLFEPRPAINVLATAPTEWQARADQHFLENLTQVSAAHMEKYCTEQADSLICSSDYLLQWMKTEGWAIGENARILPALRPYEWRFRGEHDKALAPRQNIRELVFSPAPTFIAASCCSATCWTFWQTRVPNR